VFEEGLRSEDDEEEVEEDETVGSEG
jgi:hypothetical protein